MKGHLVRSEYLPEGLNRRRCGIIDAYDKRAIRRTAAAI